MPLAGLPDVYLRNLEGKATPMRTHRIRRTLTLLLIATKVSRIPTEPAEPIPDLTGSYNLVSITSPDLENGATLTPPAVEATLKLVQYTGNGERAIGDASFYVAVRSPSMSTGGDGSYEQERSYGPFSMTLNGLKYTGRYTLDGDTLAVSPAAGSSQLGFPYRLPTGRTVWVRDNSM